MILLELIGTGKSKEDAKKKSIRRGGERKGESVAFPEKRGPCMGTNGTPQQIVSGATFSAFFLKSSQETIPQNKIVSR